MSWSMRLHAIAEAVEALGSLSLQKKCKTWCSVLGCFRSSVMTKLDKTDFPAPEIKTEVVSKVFPCSALAECLGTRYLVSHIPKSG